MWSTCIPCMRARAEAEAKLNTIRNIAIQRANDNKQDYIIWVDTEDYKLRISEADEAVTNGRTIVEFVFHTRNPFN